jgi:hypothetical protein
VRDKDQANAITDVYPSVETILADLDNDSVLNSEARKADVVLSKFARLIIRFVLIYT